MSDLEDLILERIDDSGPITFAEFMELALYHPELGYYSSGKVRSEWGGDFITSPEMDPAFGGLWARAVEQIWTACGRPAGFTVAEIGPGEGGFAHGFLSAVAGTDCGDALGYVMVERITALRERQSRRLEGWDVAWRSDMKEVEPLEAGVVFANEVLDNVPVRLVRKKNDRLEELRVSSSGKSLRMLPVEPDENVIREMGEAAALLPDGVTMEVGLEGAELARRAASLIDNGAVIFVDYGDHSEPLARRTEGTLVCYSPAGTDDRPLKDPGTKDITAHVNWTSIRRHLEEGGSSVAGPLSQRTVLRNLGSADLDQKLRGAYEKASAEGNGAEGLRALSRRQAIAALVDPGGLGRLGVMTGTKGIGRLSFMTDPAGES